MVPAAFLLCLVATQGVDESLVASQGVDEAQWIARVDLPSLYHAQMNLVVADADLGVEGYDMGFPHDPREMAQQAEDKLKAGDRSAHTFHQAARGLAALRMGEALERILPACLSAYAKEIDADPGNAHLRVGFAKALSLAGSFTHNDRFFEDADPQFRAATGAAPDDLDIRLDHATMLVMRTMNHRRPDAAWLEKAVTIAGEALQRAPDEVAAQWRYFRARYVQLALRMQQEGVLPALEIAALADELAAMTADGTGSELLALTAEGYWFVSNLPGRVDPAQGLAVPADDQAVRERMQGFPDRLMAVHAPRSLQRSLAEIWWTMYAFAGAVEGWQEASQVARSMGLPEDQVLTLALMGFHRRGSATAAGAVADLLAKVTPNELILRALAVYRNEIGDDAAALEFLSQVQQPDPAVRLASAILRLRSGERARAREELTALAPELEATPLSGIGEHALGVALALDGELEAALPCLERAAVKLMAADGARATLAEVKTRLARDGD
ncbi:MAG: hypothetical protein V3T22_03730 [Planctomycetota bacterium]